MRAIRATDPMVNAIDGETTKDNKIKLTQFSCILPHLARKADHAALRCGMEQYRTVNRNLKSEPP